MEGASPAGTARTGMIAPSACKAPSGFDRISRYQRPRVPRTERTNTSPPSTTTQMITRCDGAAGSGRVSISTSSTAAVRSGQDLEVGRVAEGEEVGALLVVRQAQQPARELELVDGGRHAADAQLPGGGDPVPRPPARG